MEMHFVLLLQYICCQMGNTSGDITIFKFCHDSLDLLN